MNKLKKLKSKNLEFKLKKLHLVLVIFGLHFSTSKAQDTWDLSNNKIDNTIAIAGTNLKIDTLGLNLKMSSSPRTLVHEDEQTVLGIEQKDLSIQDYESIIGMMMKFDKVISEYKIKFEKFTGKLTIGKINIDNSNKYVWFFYIGNSDMVIDIKGYYNEILHSKYEKPFEKVFKSAFIDMQRKLSIYEDLPFYLDEVKFPYKKDLSFMPQSVAISRTVGKNIRFVTLSYFETDMSEIEELRKNPEGEDYFKDDEREIFSSIEKSEEEFKYNGVIVMGMKLIQFRCSSKDSDKDAVNEFKDMIKSLKLR
jgi:hypothetical protein